jgi:hypothetical protein
MSSALIGYSRSSFQASGAGQPKRPNTWTSFGRVRDFAKNSISHTSLPPAKSYSDSDTYGNLAESTEVNYDSETEDFGRRIVPAELEKC